MTPPADIRLKGFRQRISPARLLALIRAHTQPLSPQTVPLDQALGRVAAQTLRARWPVPPFDRAAMDGYALQGEATFGAAPYNPLFLELAGQAPAGAPWPGRLQNGQALRIMTGAPLPPGADAVLPLEETAGERGGPGQPIQVELRGSVAPGRHVARAGEDAAPGEALVNAGRLLRPQDLGLLAAGGHHQLEIYPPPGVGLLITGQEVAPPGEPLAPGQVADANGPMLAALVARDGGRLAALARVGDSPAQLEEALRQTPGDLLLVSGGTSAGSEDHGPTLLAQGGRLLAHGVAIRPGGPVGFGLLGGRPVFLLPGNPVACLVAYDFFARLALRRLAGLPEQWPYPPQTARLAGKITSQPGRVDYVRVGLEENPAGETVAHPLAHGGAGVLSTATKADGFVVVASHQEGWPEGAEVTVWRYQPPSTPWEAALEEAEGE